MKNLFITWAKCLALTICIPVLFCLLPFVAFVDGLLDGVPYKVRLVRYYKLLSQLEVRIEPKW